MKATQRFTETECDAVYELYSYMVDVSFPYYTYSAFQDRKSPVKLNHRKMEKLAMDAGRVVLDVLQGYHLKPKRSGKVIPMKRRTV